MSPPLFLLSLAFFLSGLSGLIYETAWSRYLGLLVGHTAYAQVWVLVLFLGGMALGALWVGRRAEAIRRPLLGYAVVELAVGVYGIFFHEVYLAVGELAYGSLLPFLGGGLMGTAATWLLAGALLLPPSLLLGTTFPLMSAGFLRLTPRFPGRVLASLYFLNSLGAALGALACGFLLLPLVGLPGSVLAAGTLNVVVATVAWGVDRRWRGGETAWGGAGWRDGGATGDEVGRRSQEGFSRFLPRLLLAVTFGTALASFIYEVAWIRMLSLVLGSANHSFEIMLSAFILGLALGSLWVRRKADIWQEPVAVLGWIQWLMGASALASLPLYAASFGWTAELLAALDRTPEGYALFNLGRYGLSAALMLPATFCAGMTLPLITRALLAAGAGEGAVGWVYGVNTLGSILGVALASLFLLPLLGLQGLLVSGATLDMALGVALLAWGHRNAGKVRRATSAVGVAAAGAQTSSLSLAGMRFRGFPVALGLGAGTLVAAALGLTVVRLDRSVLASGVYRTGRLAEGKGEVLFYRDGRTASVAVERRDPGVRILSTNGKPDASLSELWLEEGERKERRGRRPLSLDEPTQVLLPLVTLAHNPAARTAVVVGQGSGLSSHVLLGSPHLGSVTTVEIEPAMVEASRLFLPATRRVFEDPRSRIVVEDARAFLAGAGDPVDLIVSEPSNPWVSGVASLFTVEFYQRVHDRLAPGGVFGQWFHLYEMEDPLVLSVLAALHRVFPDFQVYLLHAFDLLIVAAREGPLKPADWTVLEFPGVASDLSGIYPLWPQLLEACRFLNRQGLSPLLDGWRPNSDFYPILDLGAERARFLRRRAEEVLALAEDPSPLRGTFLPVGSDEGEGLDNPLPQVPSARALVLRNRLRAWGRGETPPEDRSLDREFLGALHRRQRAWALVQAGGRPVDWPSWVRDVVEGAGWETATGWRVVEPKLLVEAAMVLRRWGGPREGEAVFQLISGVEKRDWDLVVQATEVLEQALDRGEEWVPPAFLLEAGVVARLQRGLIGDAVLFLQRLGSQSGLNPAGVRARLLMAHLDRSLVLR